MHYLLISIFSALVLISCPILSFAQIDSAKRNEPTLEDLLDTKISTAAKYEQTLRDAPSNVSVITSDDIAHYGWQTLGDALLSQPGFFGRDDRNYVYLGFRGFQSPSSYSNGILLLLNGHTMNDNVYFSPFFGNDLSLDMYNIDRIEIVRGPGSSLYGTSAMLAVINIITKKGNVIDGIRSSLKVGSWNNTQGTLSLGKSFENGLNISISGKIGYVRGQDLYFKEYDDSSTNNGWARGLDWERFSGGFIYVNYEGFSLNAFQAYRDKGIPTGSYDIIFNNSAAWTTDERSFAELKFDHKFTSRLSIMARAYFDYYNYYGSYPYDTVEYDGNTGKWAGTELQAVWDPFLNNRLTAGIEFKNNFHADNRIWQSDNYLFNKNSPYNVFSVYGQDQWQVFDNLNIDLGLRYDNYTNMNNSTAPRISINYNLSKNGVIKGIYGEAFRVPNIYELYYEDNITQKGNPYLSPERIITYELVYQRQVSRNFNFNFSVFHYQMKNMIGQVQDPVDSLFQYRNLGSLIVNGLEVCTNYHLSSDFSIYANYSYNSINKSQSEQELIDSPVHDFKSGVNYLFLKRFSVSLEGIYESERQTRINSLTNPFFLVNAYVVYSPEQVNNLIGLNNFLNFSFRINNLFNVNYAYPGGIEHKQIIIPQNGRNFLLELSILL
jgi:iron complex outermembrane receptor protein